LLRRGMLLAIRASRCRVQHLVPWVRLWPARNWLRLRPARRRLEAALSMLQWLLLLVVVMVLLLLVMMMMMIMLVWRLRGSTTLCADSRGGVVESAALVRIVPAAAAGAAAACGAGRARRRLLSRSGCTSDPRADTGLITATAVGPGRVTARSACLMHRGTSRPR
jgi:hypothetical protein